MDITFEKTGDVTGTLVATAAPEDYAPAYAKSLKDTARSLNLPGFRPGKVPVAIVKKRFGAELLAEQVNKLVGDELDKYVEAESIPLLLRPFASPENDQVRVEDGATMTFKFDVALKPQFDISFTKDDALTLYDITVEDSVVEQHVNMYRSRGGRYEKVDSYTENDMVKGTLTELNVEGGICEQNVIMLPSSLKDVSQKALFAGAKVGDVLTINPSQAYEGNETQLAALLRIERTEAASHKGDFSYEIKEITRYVQGELTQAIFDEAFPDKGITTEEAFVDAIREQVKQQYAREAKYKFIADLGKYAKEKVGALTFPEELLKRVITPPKDASEEQQAEDFKRQLDGLKWELILEKLSLAYDVQVTSEEIIEAAKERVRQQYAAYGLLNIKEEYLIEGSSQLLKDKRQIENLQYMRLSEKVAEKVQEHATIEVKTVSMEEFRQLAHEAA